MAGYVTHLAVADKIIDSLGEDAFKNKTLFYCGSIGPNAIHARPGNTKEMKMHTHFMDGIQKDDLLKEENQELFHIRIREFINLLQKKYANDKTFDFYLGYLVHILTDELSIKTVREEYKEIIQKDDEKALEKPWEDIYRKDIYNNNLRLAREYPFKVNVREELYKEWGYSVPDLLIHEELSGSKWWVCRTYFDKAQEPKECKYLTYQRTLDFIDECSLNIIVQLSNEKNYPGILKK